MIQDRLDSAVYINLDMPDTDRENGQLACSHYFVLIQQVLDTMDHLLRPSKSLERSLNWSSSDGLLSG